MTVACNPPEADIARLQDMPDKSAIGGYASDMTGTLQLHY